MKAPTKARIDAAMRFYAHAFHDSRMPSIPPRVPSMFEQLMAAASSAAHPEQQSSIRRPWQFQPGPRPGSATDRVLQELRRVAPLALEHGQLRMRCGASHGAVSWALRYLESTGQVAGFNTDKRNKNWKKWRST